MLLGVVLCTLLIFISSLQGEAGFNTEEFAFRVVEHLENKDEVINFNYKIDYDSISTEELNIAIEEALEITDDYTKYTVKNWKVKVRGNSQTVDVEIEVDYHSSRNEDDFVFQRSEDIVNSLISPGMNIHQKIKVITDYIARNVYYDDYKVKYSAYDALRNGSSTCQGYALLTYILLNEAGIENQIVIGDLGNQSHAWNLVNVDGDWYHLDLTQISSQFHRYGSLFYNEYLVTNVAFSSTYSWNQADYPQAYKDYYVQLRTDLRYNDFNLLDELVRDLNLFFLKDEYTVSSAQDMKLKLKSRLLDEEQEVNFRSTIRNLGQKEVSKIISQVFSDNRKLTEIYRGWNLTIYPSYLRDERKNSKIIIINFSKR